MFRLKQTISSFSNSAKTYISFHVLVMIHLDHFLIFISCFLITECLHSDSNCWWSGCQPRFWLYTGCFPQDKYYAVKSVPCTVHNIDSLTELGADIFQCCPIPSEEMDDSDNQLEEIESGICSWYGGSEIPKGAVTASGQIFDKFQMTAAHKTLPFGTRIRVKHTKTKRTIDVVINDRGPFIRGRILDLTFTAFGELEDRDKGLFRCSYKILTPSDEH